jgi:hypothetical protein
MTLDVLKNAKRHPESINVNDAITILKHLYVFALWEETGMLAEAILRSLNTMKKTLVKENTRKQLCLFMHDFFDAPELNNLVFRNALSFLIKRSFQELTIHNVSSFRDYITGYYLIHKTHPIVDCLQRLIRAARAQLALTPSDPVMEQMHDLLSTLHGRYSPTMEGEPSPPRRHSLDEDAMSERSSVTLSPHTSPHTVPASVTQTTAVAIPAICLPTSPLPASSAPIGRAYGPFFLAAPLPHTPPPLPHRSSTP